MPYIEQRQRLLIDDDHELPKTAGELNYAITRIVNAYAYAGSGLNYVKMNDVLGALEGAKAEFYRRVTAPYEDGKMATNGDVYGC